MATQAALLQIQVDAATGKARRELQAFDKRLKAVDQSASSSSKSISQFGRDTDRASRPVDSVSGKLLNLNQAFLSVGNAAKTLKLPVLISAVGPAAQGVSALAAGTTSLVGALVPAAGAATGAAAAYGAMGQAAGVIALSGVKELGAAVGGLNEEMDTSADAFKALSPEAQKFAGVLQETKAPLLDIQAAVQKPLFEGMNKGLVEARKNLPALKTVLQGTAQAMGRLAQRAGEFVGRGAFGKDFTTIGEGNTKVLERMGRVGFHLADAFRHVMVEAQPLITWMTKAVVRFSEYVEQSAKAGRKSGDLAEFFEETRRILSIVVPAVGNLAKGLWNVLRAGSDLGTQVWQKLADSAEEFRKWTESAKGENAIEQWFEDAKKPLWELGRLIRDVGKLFGGLGKGNAGITNLLKTLRKDLLPVIAKMFKGTEGFATVFVDFAVEGAKALTPFLGPSGPLTMLVKAMTSLLKIFNDLIEAVPILGTALVTMAGMRTVQNLLSLFGIGGKGAKGGKGGMVGPAGILGGGGGSKGISGMAKGLAKLSAGFAGFMAATGFISDPGASGLRGRLINAAAALGLTGDTAEKQTEKFRELGAMVKDAGSDFGDLDMTIKQINIAQAMGDITAEMGDKLRAMVGDSRRHAEKLQNALNANLDLDEIEHGWSKHMRNMAGISQKELDRIGDLLRDKPRKGVEAFSAAMDRMVASIRQAMKDGEISTRKGNKRIHSILIDQLGAYGIKHAGAQKIIQATEQGGKTLQRGGPIDQGRPSGDSVPAMLERGEYVLNRNAVASVGKQNLDALNFGAAKRFAAGGMAGLQPGISRLAKWANQRYGLNISSGFRSGTGSLHNIGAAVDLVPPGMAATKGIFGAFKNQLAELFYDPWGGWNDGQMIGAIGDHLDHIHAAIIGAGAKAGIGRAKIKLPRFKATAAMFEPGAAGLNNSARGLEKIMGRRAAAASAVGDAGAITASGPLQAIARRMVTGRWGGGQWPFFNDLVNRESGWDPTAVNPRSGAAGLAQALPPSKYPPGAWPYTGKSSAVKQLQWMISYIAERYGDPAGAIAWHNSHNWYQRGGMVGMAEGGFAGGAPGGGGGKDKDKGKGKGPFISGTESGVPEPLRKLKKHFQRLGKRIARIDERIQIAQTYASYPTSPGGTELAGSEKTQQLGLYGNLLNQLMDQRGVAREGLRTAKRFKRSPAFFRDALVELEGLTGGAGRLLDTKTAIAELTATPPAGTAGISIEDLLRIREGATLGLLGGLGNGLAAGGAAPSPSHGPEVNISYANGMEWLRDFVSVQVDGRDRRTNIRSLAGVKR